MSESIEEITLIRDHFLEDSKVRNSTLGYIAKENDIEVISVLPCSLQPRNENNLNVFNWMNR